MSDKIIYENGGYRIVETIDNHYDIEELKGDCFRPEVNANIEPAVLKKEALEFERLVYDQGVYGYALEVWDPTVGAGWVYKDGCYGFVGQYDKNSDNFNHYIVKELIALTRGD